MQEEYYAYIKGFFKKWASIYDRLEIFLPGIRTKTVALAAPEKGSRVLDVATGTGRLAFAFAKLSYEVIGVDLSEDMLAVARHNNQYPNVRFQQADATQLPFADNEFSVSCISLALHDMPQEIRERVLREMTRVTKPNGTIMIVDYTLPQNRLARNLGYRFIKSYESIYWPSFINTDLNALAARLIIQIVAERSIMGGFGRIWKAINIKAPTAYV